MRTIKQLAEEIKSYQYSLEIHKLMRNDYAAIVASEMDKVPVPIVSTGMTSSYFFMPKEEYLKHFYIGIQAKEVENRKLANSLGVQYEELPIVKE